MVLNHASLRSPDLYTALGWLKDLVIGMRELITECVAQSSLTACILEHEIEILPDCSWHDARQKLRKAGERDEYLYLIKLMTNYSSPVEVEPNFTNQIRVCDSKQLTPAEGAPLVLCATNDCIAVGFPSDCDWDTDQIAVNFSRPLSDGSIQETCKSIDNLTKSVHASLICARYRAALFNQDPSVVWEQRDDAFPNLVFGPEVKRPSEILGTAVGKLVQLDRSVAEWRIDESPAPHWHCEVTRESESVRNNATLLNKRRFRSRQGGTELFELHARIGSGFRIHLRIDAKTREVEIGYIGRHL